MKTQTIAFLFAATLLAAFSGCSKDDVNPNPGGNNNPPVDHTNDFGETRCFKAKGADVPTKHGSNLCSESPGAVTINTCYSMTVSNTDLYNNLTYGMASMLCQGASATTPANGLLAHTAINWYEGSVLWSNASDLASPKGCWAQTDSSLDDMQAAVLCTRSKVDANIDAQDANACFNQTSLALDAGYAGIVCSQSNQGDYTTDAGYEPVACLEDIVNSDYTNTTLVSNAAILCQKAKVHFTDTTTYNPLTEQCYIDSATNQAKDLTDRQASILCSGAASTWAAAKCYGNTALSLSYDDAALLCSGATESNWNYANDCYAAARSLNAFSADSHDAAVLCSGNNGLFTTTNHASYQTNNRAIRGGNDTWSSVARDDASNGGRINNGIRSRGGIAGRLSTARAAYRTAVASTGFKAQVRAGNRFKLAARKQMGQIVPNRAERSMARVNGGLKTDELRAK